MNKESLAYYVNLVDAYRLEEEVYAYWDYACRYKSAEERAAAAMAYRAVVYKTREYGTLVSYLVHEELAYPRTVASAIRILKELILTMVQFDRNVKNVS